MLDWKYIDTVLLDMDGTLLDLHFDDHFWLEYLPQKYAARHQMPLKLAKQELQSRYDAISGTLEWYCLDHWRDELDMDMVSLKEQIRHLISFRPDAARFLERLKRADKRLVLVTNAHQDSLALKLRHTGLETYLHQIYSAHAIGLPKEDAAFWPLLQELEQFNPERTLFLDDNIACLKSASSAGIANAMGIARPNSTRPERLDDHYTMVRDFDSLLAGL